MALVCRGSYRLGTACGQCQRCADEAKRLNLTPTLGQTQQLPADVIDTRQLGHMTHVATEPRFRDGVGDDLIEVRFDTGFVLYAPPALFRSLAFTPGDGQ